ncbi:MAG: hypothetical protein ACPGQL_02880 [Thermoplasmatota archaeon]
MSDYTTASSLLLAIVAGGALALALVTWSAADRLGDVRLRWIAAAFGIFFVKSCYSIYTIQVPVWHHELTELAGAVFDVAMVACLAAPLMRRGAQ